MHRFYGLAARLRQNFGKRVQKVPLDFDFSCPNRDGTISRNGCIFCNPRGSGSGLNAINFTIQDQWNFWTNKFARIYNAKLFLAYLQSYSNTYGPIEKLAEALNQLKGLDKLVGVCIGTRPDCLNDQKLKMIADLKLPETWIDLGLQTSNNDTLKLINRGHTAECFAEAVHKAHDHGLEVCAHVIAGLPNETIDDFLASVEFVNSLPVAGIKFHNLYVPHGTKLQQMYESGEFTPFSLDDYLEMFRQGLGILRPDIVVHRLSADPEPGELVAPEWTENKRFVLDAIDNLFEETNLWQGCYREDAGDTPPEWYSPNVMPPNRSRKI